MRSVVIAIALAASGLCAAATPPALINYQGVLRNAADQPLTGSYDVVFHLFDASLGGNEVVMDRHLAANLLAVQVSGGLFSTTIGGGDVLDGSGPGSYSIATAFRDFPALWLEVQIGSETLQPRTRIASAGYALNSSYFDGRSPSSYLDTSATTQTKLGQLSVTSSAPGGVGILASGLAGGASFQDADGSGIAYAAHGNLGVEAYGTVAGGYFAPPDLSSWLYCGSPGIGVQAAGIVAGGTFTQSGGGASASVASQGLGILAEGVTAGGHFVDLNGSGEAYVADGETGIEASGGALGARFSNSNGTTFAEIGLAGTGIYVQGGDTAGFFLNNDGSGQAFVAVEDDGIIGQGNEAGGYFKQRTTGAYAWVGYLDRGIWGKGHFAGGTFSHPDNVTFWADVSTPTKKIQGTGAVSFVQNHPAEKDKMIVYAAPEGDEVAVYTRGSSRLVNGEAHVRLGETFALVANPDIGLTAHLTARGDEPATLSVAMLSPHELVVRGPAGSGAEFDYLVYGLRIGFERHPAVQKKERDGFLPDAAAFDALGAADPILGSSTALARFTAMRAASGGSTVVDLGRAERLAATINAGKEEIVAGSAAAAAAEQPEPRVPRPPSPELRPARPVPIVDRGASPAPSSSRELAPQLTIASVSGTVAPGDVLVLDAAAPGSLRASDHELDRGVAGCAIAAPGGIEVPSGKSAIGTTGVISCRVDASFGAISIGDLLTTSGTPGHAMAATAHAEGAILGKAMEPLATGTGVINVLVTLR